MKSVESSPTRVAREVKRELARLSRPTGSFDASRYFRTDVDLGFHNVGTQRVRGIARAVVVTHPTWDVDDAMQLAELLIADRHLETKVVAIEVVARYKKSFSPSLLAAWKRWLAKGYSANWATTDGICGSLIGPLLVAYPHLVKVVESWSHNRNMWVRRASAVGLLPAIRRNIAMDAAYRVARVLHADEADMIQKAVGWMLREAGKVDPVRLERYLRANGPRIRRTTVRYAIERFEPRKRRELLLITRLAER